MLEDGRIQNKILTTNGFMPKRPIAKTAPKILISKNIVQNGPLHCPKRPIIQPKRPTATSKTPRCHYPHSPTSKATLKFYMLRPVIHGLEALMILKQSNVWTGAGLVRISVGNLQCTGNDVELLGLRLSCGGGLVDSTLRRPKPRLRPRPHPRPRLHPCLCPWMAGGHNLKSTSVLASPSASTSTSASMSTSTDGWQTQPEVNFSFSIRVCIHVHVRIYVHICIHVYVHGWLADTTWSQLQF